MNEITMTLNGRVVTPAMAIWNIMGYQRHEEKPPVKLLPFHLEGRHRVRFDASMTSEQLQLAADQQKSEFTAWMEYNRTHDDGNLQLLYQDFPNGYVFDGRTRKWKKRKNKAYAIGRLYGANPNQGEYFELWRLLQRRPGAKSYADLYTVDSVTYSKPSEACRALGLNFDDTEWRDFFEEVRHASTGHNMRTLFVNACVHGAIRDGRALYDEFKGNLSDDLPTRARHRRLTIPADLEEPYHDYALFLLRQMFFNLGFGLEDFNLPQPVHDWEPSDVNQLLTAEQYDADQEQASLEANLPLLNDGQRAAFDTITSGIESDPQSAHYFIQGAGGTGKTFLYKTLCHYYRAQGDVVLCVASSGIAAQLLPGGRTSHSRFKIPLSGDESSRCNIPKQSQLADLIRQTKLIIWDEVPMQHKVCFTAVHRSLCDILGEPEDGALFGGVPSIFGGDFAQILPVVQKGSRSDIVRANIQCSHVWQKLNVLFLTENMRLRNSPANEAFANWIGRMSYDRSLYGSVELPQQVDVTSSLQSLIDHVYPLPTITQVDENTTFFKDRAILCTRNDAANSINETVLRCLGGPNAEERVYESADRAAEDDNGLAADLPPAYLASLSLSGLPPASLRLRKGAPVMLLRNLYTQHGLCNGTRMVIVRLLTHGVVARIDGGDFDGDVHFIPRIDCTSNEADLPFKLFRRQLPIRLCFAMTINKSQGQTLHTVGVDLRNPAFTHGQLYVALSRVTDVGRLKVLLPEENGRRTINEVYDEVLLLPHG